MKELDSMIVGVLEEVRLDPVLYQYLVTVKNGEELVKVGEICQMVRSTYAVADAITPKAVGQALRAMGFRITERMRNGFSMYWDGDLIQMRATLRGRILYENRKLDELRKEYWTCEEALPSKAIVYIHGLESALEKSNQEQDRLRQMLRKIEKMAQENGEE